jgi:hypothetical protein
MLTKVYPLVGPTANDTILCIHKSTKTIKIRKQQDLNSFFSTTIWQMPVKDKAPELDGESWRVMGRNGDKKVSVVRWNFEDSLYYSNIQKLLDPFKIKDYKYNKIN